MNIGIGALCAERRRLWAEHRDAVRELIACADAKAAGENARTLAAYAAASKRCQFLRKRAQEHEGEHGCGTPRGSLDGVA